MTTTTALFFDLDDTLLADETASDAAFLATCAHAGERYSLDERSLAYDAECHARHLWQASLTYAYCHAIGISAYEGLWGHFVGDDLNLRALHAWAPTYRREAWSRALDAQGIADTALAEELATMFQRERRARQMVFPDVLPILARLRESHQLALITNGAPDLQREKIAASGLADYFDAIVVSGELGIGKPDPRIFAHTLGLVGASPEESLMIGDNLMRDVAGAQRAGLHAIWINRLDRRIPTDVEVVPNGTITELGELLALL